MNTPDTLKHMSNKYRRQILQIIKTAGAGHTGGDLSCLDILNVLYNSIMNIDPKHFDNPDRDRFIMSKGHCVEALYTILADRGFFPFEDLETLCRYKSAYVGHPTKKVHGVEQNTGALGHGLPIACGVALAGKMDNRDYRVFTLLGDGELAEGSNWEGFLFAAHHNLDNLVAIVDLNGLQISGTTKKVCNTEPLNEKLSALDWSVLDVDGHDYNALHSTFSNIPHTPGKPTFIRAATIKGKGVSFMENVAKWHHGVPKDEEYIQALNELESVK